MMLFVVDSFVFRKRRICLFFMQLIRVSSQLLICVLGFIRILLFPPDSMNSRTCGLSLVSRKNVLLRRLMFSKKKA